MVIHQPDIYFTSIKGIYVRWLVWPCTLNEMNMTWRVNLLCIYWTQTHAGTEAQTVITQWTIALLLVTLTALVVLILAIVLVSRWECMPSLIQPIHEVHLVCIATWILFTTSRCMQRSPLYTHTHTHKHTHTRAHTHTCTHTRAHTHVHTHTSAHTHTHVPCSV